MKKRISTSCQSLAVIGVLVAAMPAYGDTFLNKGNLAGAIFESVDETQCISTSVDVFAADDATILVDPPGQPIDPFGEVELFVFVSQFDFCASAQLLEAFCEGTLERGDLQVDGRLDWATLNATAACFDSVSSSSFDLVVDLGWVAVGDLGREQGTFFFDSPPPLILFNFRNTFRPAEASGSVSDGVTNFTPEVSVDAFIQTTMSREVAVGP